MMLMLGIVASASLTWVRKIKLREKIIARLRLPITVQNVGYILCVIIVGLTLYVVIPTRQDIPYYRWIDQKDYEAFVWIKDNIDEQYEISIMDPYKGIPFTAITGKIAYARITGLLLPNSRETRKFLDRSCVNTKYMEDNVISIVYTREKCNNPDLTKARDNVYLLNNTKLLE